MKLTRPTAPKGAKAALIGGGLLFGAALLVVAQYLSVPVKIVLVPEVAAPPLPAVPEPTASASASASASAAPSASERVRAFTLDPQRKDVTSPRSGALASDGRLDWAFTLVTEGPISAIVITQCDETGRPVGAGVRWGTSDWNPSAPVRESLEAPTQGAWQLAVFDGARGLNTPSGGMTPLGAGTHRLTLRASTATPWMSPYDDAIVLGSNLRAYVVGPNGEAQASALLYVESDPGTPAPNARPPFDRGAAAASLAGVRLDACAKLAGATPNGRAEITFAPDGKADPVTVIEGPAADSAAGRCVTEAFRKNARVPAFTGAPIHVKKSFSLPTTDTGAR
jgi:hypothetical protein